MLRLILLGAVTVVSFDALASLLLPLVGGSLLWMFAGQGLVYFGTGVAAGRLGGFWTGARCGAAVAEHRLGAGRGSRHMVLLTLGTGIGGGLILNGELYRGSIGAAGELGHMTINFDGPPCQGYCNGFGHLAIAVPDAYKACEDVAAKGGKVTRPAGPMKHGTTVIAFVEDPDGYKIEFIQRA